MLGLSKINLDIRGDFSDMSGANTLLGGITKVKSVTTNRMIGSMLLAGIKL
jgi:hypothetical protein